MAEKKEDVTFFVNDSVYSQVVAMTLAEIDGISPKGRSISVKRQERRLVADIHIIGYYGDNILALAEEVQRKTIFALQEMADPESLSVEVTVDDIVFKE